MELKGVSEHAKARFFDRSSRCFMKMMDKHFKRQLEVIPRDKTFKYLNNSCKVQRFYRMDDLVLVVSEDDVVVTVLNWVPKMFDYKNNGI